MLSATTWSLLAAIAGAAVGLVATVVALLATRMTRRREAELEHVNAVRLSTEHLESTLDATRPTTVRPALGDCPAPPKGLIEACRKGTCMLFAGSGLAARYGQPTWREAVLALIQRFERQLPDPTWSLLAREVTSGHADMVMDVIVARMGADEVRSTLREIAGAPATGLNRNRELEPIPFVGLISSAWDDLPQRLFADRHPRLITPEDSRGLERAISRDAFVSVPVYGLLADASLILTAEELRLRLEDNAEFARLLGSIYATHTLLFMGASVSGVEDFLTALGIRAPSEHTHYALVPRTTEAELRSSRLLERFNVELLRYGASPGHPEVSEFASGLARHTRRSSPRRQIEALGLPSLKEVRLENIGPFDQLEIELTEASTLLVGDNGCGKSTVLRAIALALCGSDATSTDAAERLLKADAPSGSIELRFGSATLSTRLRKGRSGRVSIAPGQFTPVQTGAWLALGFPPLRGVSLRKPSRTTTLAPQGPGAHDLLPLLAGNLDTRLDDLKQWIVDPFVEEAARRIARRRDLPPRSRSPSSVERLFRVLSSLMPEDFSSIELARIDVEPFEVIVQTPDGLIPIDFLSQGMESVLSWVGTLITRLEEAENLAIGECRALVLVDEIDAHLHPRWQRNIVGALEEEFSGIQLVATTHSPLVVGAAGGACVWHLQRTPEGPRAMGTERGYQGWRTDQILAGPAFETSPRDPHTEKLLETYDRLAAMDEPSARERKELARVARELDAHVPSAPEREQARTAQGLIEEAAAERIKEMPAGERREVMKRLRLQILDSLSRFERPGGTA